MLLLNIFNGCFKKCKYCVTSKDFDSEINVLKKYIHSSASSGPRQKSEMDPFLVNIVNGFEILYVALESPVTLHFVRKSNG